MVAEHDAAGARPLIRGRRSPVVVAAAVLAPPLALHLAAAMPRLFWIGTALTVLGFVPGIVFALVTVLRRAPATVA